MEAAWRGSASLAGPPAVLAAVVAGFFVCRQVMQWARIVVNLRIDGIQGLRRVAMSDCFQVRAPIMSFPVSAHILLTFGAGPGRQVAKAWVVAQVWFYLVWPLWPPVLWANLQNFSNEDRDRMCLEYIFRCLVPVLILVEPFALANVLKRASSRLDDRWRSQQRCLVRIATHSLLCPRIPRR